MGEATAPVLYVEDDENDALFMQRAFRIMAIPHALHVVRDGKEAITYLRGCGRHAAQDSSPPCLIVLDLNMPISSGFDVLQWVRSQPRFQSVPVVVFSASDRKLDKDKASQLGASAFFTKPHDSTQIPQMLEEIRDRWLTTKPV